MDIAHVTSQLAAAGLDIVQPFPAHELARELGIARLHVDARPVGLLVGNTRAMWPCLARARAADAAFATVDHPIEQYVERSIASVCAEPTLYAHARYDGAYLPFQRIAVAAGLAGLAPTQLLVHPVYGPWFALRAVILCAGEPPVCASRIECACDCAAAGCAALFERAKQNPEDWRAWLAMRDACPIGRAYRYSDQQIAYHYTKQRQHLP